MKAVCILQARMGSARLRGKVLAEICGRPMLAHIIERLRHARTVHEIVVATTINAEDDVIADLARESQVSSFRGAADDVVDRITRAAEQRRAELVVHACGDNPLVDPETVDRLVTQCREGDYGFAFMAGLPVGAGADVFASRTLISVDRLAKDPAHREHVNAYVFDHLERFKVARLFPDAALQRPDLRLTVDTAEDLYLVREIYQRLYRPGKVVRLGDVLHLSEKEPQLFAANRHIQQRYVSAAARELRQA